MISWLQGDHYKDSILTFTLSPYPTLSKPPLSLSHELFLHTAPFFPFFLLYVQRKDRREHGTLFDGIRGHTHHSALTDICSLPSRKATRSEYLEPSIILGSDSVLSGISLLTFRRSEEQNEPSQCSLAFRLHASSGKLWGRALTRRKRMPFLRTSTGSNS